MNKTIVGIPEGTTIQKVSPAAIIGLRHKVLRPGLPIETAHFKGDEEGRHYVLFLTDLPENDPVSCLSFMLNECDGQPAWQLRGMATDKSLQGSGLGGALLDWSEQAILLASPVHALWCNARINAVGFYVKHGWEVVSEEFDIPGVGLHRKMTKYLC